MTINLTKIKELITKYIEARIELLKTKKDLLIKNAPCTHEEWKLLKQSEWQMKTNPDYQWTEWFYQCPKCLTTKLKSSKDPDIK